MKDQKESNYFNKLMAGMMLPRRCKDACIYTMDMDDSGNYEKSFNPFNYTLIIFKISIYVFKTAFQETSTVLEGGAWM